MSVIDDAPRASVRGVVRGIGGDPGVAGTTSRRPSRAARGQPRLLLVGTDAEPPGDWDGLTDWVRLPVDDRDLCARVAALQRFAACAPARCSTSSTCCGAETAGARWRRSRRASSRCCWRGAERWSVGATSGSRRGPTVPPATRAVDARLRRLRDRVEPLGLQIHNVRRRGLMLEVVDRRVDAAGAELTGALEVEEPVRELLDLGAPRLRLLHRHEHELREADREELLEPRAQRRDAHHDHAPRVDVGVGLPTMLAHGSGTSVRA